MFRTGVGVPSTRYRANLNELYMSSMEVYETL